MVINKRIPTYSMNIRQNCIDVYGNTYFVDLKLMDEWSNLYTDPVLFWQSQYARCYAKEIFDIAIALEKDDILSKNIWEMSNATEEIAQMLEKSLILVRTPILRY